MNLIQKFASVKLFVALALLTLSTGCGAAAVSVSDGHYAVVGGTSRPIAAIEAASNARVNETNAETYQQAVENGYAYPYQGGGYGNDYWMYYRGVVPTQPASPAPAASATETEGGYATRAEVAAVLSVADSANATAKSAEEKADDGLRMHRKLCERDGSCPAQPQPATK